MASNSAIVGAMNSQTMARSDKPRILLDIDIGVAAAMRSAIGAICSAEGRAFMVLVTLIVVINTINFERN